MTMDVSDTNDKARLPMPADFSLIAGPCSAESLAQLRTVAACLDGLRTQGYPIEALRAGVWKPRTRPGHFEGYGERALTIHPCLCGRTGGESGQFSGEAAAIFVGDYEKV